MTQSITAINEVCRDLAKMRDLPEPTLVGEDTCSLCGSVTLPYVLEYLQDGGDGQWLEPITGTHVSHFLLKNGHRFNMRHLYDEPLTDTARDFAMGVLEDHAGNLELFVRELSKYYEE